MSNQYLLDTNICVQLLHGKYNVKEKILTVGLQNCYISAITLAELYYGAYNSRDVKASLNGVDMISNAFQVIPVASLVSNIFGQEKTNLKKRGMLIDDFDILIGATANQHKLILVTENTKHLERICPNIENWINRN